MKSSERTIVAQGVENRANGYIRTWSKWSDGGESWEDHVVSEFEEPDGSTSTEMIITDFGRGPIPPHVVMVSTVDSSRSWSTVVF
ncbi:hypothetical protein WMF30_07395 [Sorangium sp. So ce134]